MSERQRGYLTLLPRTAVAAEILAAALIVIWATTGAGYFWPMWPMWGFAVLVAAGALHRWRRSPLRPASRLTEIGVMGGVVVGAYVALWAMAGGGYFWPIWPIIGFVLIVALPWALTGRRVLEERVEELARTRSGVLDVQASELRRIERDLHDGAQARLVALAMKLGRAEDRLGREGGDEVSALLREAREDATAAVRELRELARGIAPPVLTDRGLAAAVRSLAERSGSPVSVRADLGRRPIPAVEAAAYFVVAEALTNAAKHAPRARVEVCLDERGGDLFVEVTDFGPGGADARGGGLTGLAQRVEALDGRLSVTSPVGVGTQIEATLPCGW